MLQESECTTRVRKYWLYERFGAKNEILKLALVTVFDTEYGQRSWHITQNIANSME